jgi:hypothetical protein
MNLDLHHLLSDLQTAVVVAAFDHEDWNFRKCSTYKGHTICVGIESSVLQNERHSVCTWTVDGLDVCYADIEALVEYPL